MLSHCFGTCYRAWVERRHSQKHVIIAWIIANAVAVIDSWAVAHEWLCIRCHLTSWNSETCALHVCFVTVQLGNGEIFFACHQFQSQQMSINTLTRWRHHGVIFVGIHSSPKQSHLLWITDRRIAHCFGKRNWFDRTWTNGLCTTMDEHTHLSCLIMGTWLVVQSIWKWKCSKLEPKNPKCYRS